VRSEPICFFVLGVNTGQCEAVEALEVLEKVVNCLLNNPRVVDVREANAPVIDLGSGYHLYNLEVETNFNSDEISRAVPESWLGEALGYSSGGSRICIRWSVQVKNRYAI
jgi:hypothetical protein